MKRFRIPIVVFLALFVVSCGGFENLVSDNPISKFAKMPPKQKATVAMEMYSKVYDDAMGVLTDPAATPEAKKLAAEKAKILIKYHQAVSIYKIFIDAGTTPGLDDEEELIKFVNELIKKGVNL